MLPKPGMSGASKWNRLTWMVTFLATTSLSRDLPSCPSKSILPPLGCSCKADQKNQTIIRCDAAQWNAETSSKIAKNLYGFRIWVFQLYGKPNWRDGASNTNGSSRSGGFSPFSPLCELHGQINTLELKDFIYEGEPPECPFPIWGFDNVTIDMPLFLSRMSNHVSRIHFMNQKNITGVENLRSLSTIFIYNSTSFEVNSLRGSEQLRSVEIYLTDIQTTKLNAESLPKGNNIKEITIRSSNITIVDSDSLKYLPRLNQLDLASNRIKEIPEDLLKNRHLRLNIAGNPLDCGKLMWLKKLIETKSIELIDEEITYCAHPRGTRFIGERKLDLNVDVQEQSDFPLSWAEMSACVGLFGGLGFFLTVCRPQRKPTARSLSWFEDPYPREDQPWVAEDKTDRLSN